MTGVGAGSRVLGVGTNPGVGRARVDDQVELRLLARIVLILNCRTHSLGADSDLGDIAVDIVGNGRRAGRRPVEFGDTSLILGHCGGDRLADLLGNRVGGEALPGNGAGDR